MKLRTQLLVATGVILFLPWAGYQYILQLDASLRQSQSRNLTMQAKAAAAIARVVPTAIVSDTLIKSRRVVFAPTISPVVQIALDGYVDDWPIGLDFGRTLNSGDISAKQAQQTGNRPARVNFVAMRQQQSLYLFFQVRDDKVIYHNPQKNPLASGDRLMIRIRDNSNSERRDYIVSGSAPGVAEARYADKRVDGVRPIRIEKSIESVWQDTSSGYNLEIRMPLPSSGSAFGLAIGDVDRDSTEVEDVRWTGTIDPRDKRDFGRLIFVDEALQQALVEVVPECGRIRYVNANGWLQADVLGVCKLGSIGRVDPAKISFVDAVLHRIFEQIIRSPSTANFKFEFLNGQLKLPPNRPAENGVYDYSNSGDHKMIAVEVLESSLGRRGVVLVEQQIDKMQSVSTQALVKLFSMTVLVALGVSISLLIYSSILSWRIRVLRDSTALALADGDEIIQPIASTMQDEIGDLSRGLSSMLLRVSAYTDYQKSLASRLTHELRTPLSVARTSLESIQNSKLSYDTRLMIERANSGIDQLSHILRSLSEANRLEQMIGGADFESIDLVIFVATACEVYTSIYTSHVFENTSSADKLPLSGSGDLLRQMLDKLVANAVEFSPLASKISISASIDGKRAVLAVKNIGSQLPDDQLDVFSPMVSIRTTAPQTRAEQGDAPHLGLGLYIAKLIAERHGGILSAKNNSEEISVQFSFAVPIKK